MSPKLETWKNKLTSDNLKINPFICSLILMVISVASYYLSKPYLWNYGYVSFGAVIYISILSYKVTYKDTPSFFKIVLKVTLSCYLIYLFTSYTSISKGSHPNLSDFEYYVLYYGRYFAILATILAFFRPTFTLIILGYIFFKNNLFKVVYDFGFSDVDFTSVLEMGLFMSISLMVIKCLKKTFLFKIAQKNEFLIARPYYFITMLAISAHLANYFISAYAKIYIDSNPLTWVLENNTHYLMMLADISGALYLDLGDNFKSKAHMVVSNMVPFINWGTLIIQSLAIIALLKIRWVIIITILYDIMHITIFIVTGIFFWKFIILNFAIVIGLSTIRNEKTPLSVSLSCIVFMLISPLFFYTGRFAWLDTKNVVREYFVAITDDGREFKVPTNYFLQMSVSVMQQYTIAAPYTGHEESNSLMGTVQSDNIKWNNYEKELMDKSNECKFTDGKISGIDENHESYEKVNNFIKSHHKFVLNKINDDGKFMYDLYPHHIWSNPLKFKDFYNLDKRKIVAYKLVVESGCMHLNDSYEVEFDVEVKGGYTIEVSG